MLKIIKEWRKKQFEKSEAEKHNLAFKLATFLTSILLFIILLSWYLKFSEIIINFDYLKNLFDFKI